MAQDLTSIAPSDLPDLTVVVSNSGDAAAVYLRGVLLDRGHRDDMFERLVEALTPVEYVDTIVTDPEARGWSGVAPTLGELGL